MEGFIFIFYFFPPYFLSFPRSRKGKWIGDFSCTAQPSPSLSPGLCEAVSVAGTAAQPGGRLRERRAHRGAAPTRAPPPGTFRRGTGAVRSSPGTSGPGIAFCALWGACTERAARSHKIRTANYLNSVSSHRQLNKSRLRYLKDNEHRRRKALPRPFFP